MTYVEAKCIGCGARKKIGPGRKDTPICDKCGSPMYPVEAVSKGRKK